MKCNNSGHTNDVIHKEVVVIGNGPSGIALSYMLSGNIPYLVSDEHPDEDLAARLRPALDQPLVKQDLRHLAEGLEGRSTNPVSLLLDCLLHPCADIGFELEPLVEWRNDGDKIDHIVLGKGPPGGSWHSMDPHILTLSLGSWMALPGLPYHARDGAEKRAFASNVAAYYERYVAEKNLSDNFRNGVIVTNVIYLGNSNSDYSDQLSKYCNKQSKYNDELRYFSSITDQDFKICMCNKSKECKREDCRMVDETSSENQSNKTSKWVQKINNDCSQRKKKCVQPEKETNPISRCINNIFQKAQNMRCNKRLREEISHKSEFCHRDIPEYTNLHCKECLENNNLVSKQKVKRYTNRSLSCSNDSEDLFNCDSILSRSYTEQGSSKFLRNSISLNLTKTNVPLIDQTNNSEINRRKTWYVEAFDVATKTPLKFTCNNLVLANGTSDLPNRLQMNKKLKEDPHWLLHDVKSLEIELDLYVQENPCNQDPVLIVGAGLSAADAVISARARNIPVIHVFRNKSFDLNKQLPENMYPEYHKVHQMMKDGGSTYPLYTAMPEYTLSDVCGKTRAVNLTSSTGKEIEVNVSFAVVLIGSRPNLSFLPQTFNLGVRKDVPIDSKNNTVDINKLNHMVNGFDGLYAIGPLAGDNFVRFLPGGALAIVSDLYKRCSY